MSALNEVMEKSTASDHSVDDVESAEPSRATPVTIMTVAGRSDVKVKLKANETVEGPKVKNSVAWLGWWEFIWLTLVFV